MLDILPVKLKPNSKKKRSLTQKTKENKNVHVVYKRAASDDKLKKTAYLDTNLDYIIPTDCKKSDFIIYNIKSS